MLYFLNKKMSLLTLAPKTTNITQICNRILKMLNTLALIHEQFILVFDANLTRITNLTKNAL